MGAISAYDNTSYISSESLFSKVKEDLKSYNEINLVDEGSFPKEVKRLLSRLGQAGLKESRAVMTIKNYKSILPEDFKSLYAAYRCDRETPWNKNTKPQLQGGVVYDEITNHKNTYNKCNIDCPPCVTETCTVTVKTYVNETPIIDNFCRPRLLRLSPHTKKEYYECDCLNIFHNSPHEIYIDGDYLNTNFESGHILILYYAFPVDEDSGLPLIPDDEIVQEAIEYRLKSKIFEFFYVNNLVPNIENVYKLMLAKDKDAFKEALSQAKLSSFATAVEMARKNRSKNDVYQQMAHRYYF